MERTFVRLHTKKEGLIPHYANPEASLPLNRGDHFIHKKNLTAQKETMRLVYSTTTNTKEQPALSVALNSKDHRGKTVTIVSGFVLPEQKIEELAKILKSKCGIGGTVKDRQIILQGAVRERAILLIKEQGYQVK